MKFEIMAQMEDGHREALDQPEFVGEGIETLDDAIDAAADAIEYTGAERVIVYEGNECCGYVDSNGWHHE